MEGCCAQLGVVVDMSGEVVPEQRREHASRGRPHLRRVCLWGTQARPLPLLSSSHARQELFSRTPAMPKRDQLVNVLRESSAGFASGTELLEEAEQVAQAGAA